MADFPHEIWAGRTTHPEHPTIWHDEPGVWPDAEHYLLAESVGLLLEAIAQWKRIKDESHTGVAEDCDLAAAFDIYCAAIKGGADACHSE